MKTLLTTITLIFSWLGSFAQPQGINYQGVARDSVGHPVVSQNISLRLSILDGSATGSAVYVETQNTVTNGSGLFSISIGMGSVVSGVFADVPWGVGDKWLKLEMDIVGGSNYQLIGVSQFLSVPYARFSNSSGPNGTNSGDMQYWNGTSWVIVTGGNYGQELNFCNGVPTWGGCLPILSTTLVSNIKSGMATCGGTIINDGGAEITSRGVCWNTSPNPTIALNTKTMDGNGKGSFSSNISNLTQSTTYHIRAYATNNVGTTYGNAEIFNTAQLAIGDLYHGGIVAYILQPADPGYNASEYHGLIAAQYDQSIGISWSNNGIYGVTGAIATFLGAGNANTISIVNSQGIGNYAAQLCNDLVLSGFNDWYLPSKDELNKLFLNRMAIGGFSNYWYWSSSEFSRDYAWYQNFMDGSIPLGLPAADTKPAIFYVRAVRSF